MITWIETKIKCWGFNLPPVTTCPYSTPICREKCYGRKGYLQIPSIQNRWRENLCEARQFSFTRKCRDEIKRVQREKENTKKRMEYFRWLSVGDVFCREFLQDIRKIAEELPEVKFLLLTKSYPFLQSFGDPPEKLSQKFSVFPDTEPEVIWDNWNFSLAFAGEPEDYLHMNSIVLRAQSAKHCPGDCVQCERYCWEERGDVRFSFH